MFHERASVTLRLEAESLMGSVGQLKVEVGIIEGELGPKKAAAAIQADGRIQRRKACLRETAFDLRDACEDEICLRRATIVDQKSMPVGDLNDLGDEIEELEAAVAQARRAMDVLRTIP